MHSHLKDRFDYIPTLEELEKGARPAEVIIRSTQLGGPSDSSETLFETQFRVDYEKQELLFHFATQDIGLFKIRLLPKRVPRTHKNAAGNVYRAIFKKDRGTIRMYPVFNIDSGRTLSIGTFEREGEEERHVFDTGADAKLWADLTGSKLVGVEEVRPRKARDMLFRDLLPSRIRRQHLNFMEEAKDKTKSVDDLLDILYDMPNADAIEANLRTVVSPKSVIQSAMENSHDALYSIGHLLDMINKANSAREKLQKLGISREDMKRAWDFMYLGEVPMPDV